MNNDKMFENLETILDETENKQYPDDIKMTFYYTNGEKEDFDVSILIWARLMVAGKKRLKYFFYKN
ncbi:hypothetical protein [Rummeliibacillus stabekisii]|nr:hypothetical protein [Rummeliibacillus stabekisii]AMW98437.1 hypothetical protein ATY39_02710 [Rummeliibacillus stabekisii]